MKFATVTGALSSRSLHWNVPFDVSIFATIVPLPFRSFVASAREKLPSCGSPFFAEGEPLLLLDEDPVPVPVLVDSGVAVDFAGGSGSAGPVLHDARSATKRADVARRAPEWIEGRIGALF